MARRPSLVELAVGAVATAGVVVAVTSVGSSTATTSAREQLVAVKRGVVESTVSGSGNLSPSSERELNFGASGTVTKVYVKAGQHVGTGQLLARIDDASARVDLAEAEATLASAQDTLDAATAGASSTSTTASLPVSATGHAEFASATLPAATTTTPAASTAPAATTTPATTTPAPSTAPAGTTTTPTATTTPARTTTTPAVTTTTPRTTTSGGSGSGGGSGSSSTTPATSKAAAEAAVASAQLSVTKAEEALQETVLRAPYAGTVAAVGGQVGDSVTAGSGSSSSSSSGGAASSSGGGAATGGNGSASGSGSSSSAGFITLAQLSRYTMQVSLSESDVGKVKVGQRATVTVNAASGAQFAARVSDVAVLASSSSGSSAVSYPVTLRLTQSGSKLKAGMSASADIVVGQASGLIVPTAAISGGSVTVERGGVRSTQAVQTGVAGDTSTQVVAGLRTGDRVVVRSLAATAGAGSGSGSAAGAAAGRFGGLAGGGVGTALGGGPAAVGPGGFGGAARFRGAP